MPLASKDCCDEKWLARFVSFAIDLYQQTSAGKSVDQKAAESYEEVNRDAADSASRDRQGYQLPPEVEPGLGDVAFLDIRPRHNRFFLTVRSGNVVIQVRLQIEAWENTSYYANAGQDVMTERLKVRLLEHRSTAHAVAEAALLALK